MGSLVVVLSNECSLGMSLKNSVIEDRGCWETFIARVHFVKVGIEHAKVDQKRLVL